MMGQETFPVLALQARTSLRGQLLTNPLKFAFGQVSGLLTVRSVVQPQEFGDIRQTETKMLCRFHEQQSVDIDGAVSAHITLHSLRLDQQTDALIVRDGFDPHA